MLHRKIIINLIATTMLCLSSAGCLQNQESGRFTHAMLPLHNTVRSDGGHCGNKTYSPTTALVWSKGLAQLALEHANFINNKGRLSHTGAGGRSIGERTSLSGYKWRVVAENTAHSQTPAEHIMELWLASPVHCENIFNPDFSELGGAEVNGYWTVIYAKPKS